jgi:hypothetical protein
MVVVAVAAVPSAAVPDATMKWVPGEAEIGIVTIVENVPSARTLAVPSATGADSNVRSTSDPGSHPAPITVIDSPGVTMASLTPTDGAPGG